MLTIYELSRYQLGRLYSIDPNLDKNWQETLKQIFDLLNDEGRSSVINKILTPQKITYNVLTNTYVHLPPPFLKTFVHQ